MKNQVEDYILQGLEAPKLCILKGAPGLNPLFSWEGVLSFLSGSSLHP